MRLFCQNQNKNNEKKLETVQIAKYGNANGTKKKSLLKILAIAKLFFNKSQNRFHSTSSLL